MSGILLGKTMGRSRELVEPLHRGVERTRRPRGARAHGRALADGVGADELRDHARRASTGSRATASRTATTRSRSARSSRSRRCRRGCCSRCSSCCRWASKCRPRWRCSGASSSTSTCPSTSSSAPSARDARRRARRRAAARTCGSATTPDAPWTLEEIDAEIPAGTRTALVGETGSGKTTLAYLVARLYEPQRGPCQIDGVDIRDMTLASLAATVGLVSQETYLFHASIRENLRFACPEASDEEIEDAARAAQIHELIASLPEGYDTPVGRARLPLLRRREAAHRDRAHGPAQPAGADPRRGHLGARHRDRARRPAGARRARARTHDDRDRAPPLDDPRRRPDPRARPRPHRRARHARGADRARRPLRGAAAAARASEEPAERAPSRRSREAALARARAAQALASMFRRT